MTEELKANHKVCLHTYKKHFHLKCVISQFLTSLTQDLNWSLLNPHNHSLVLNLVREDIPHSD